MSKSQLRIFVAVLFSFIIIMVLININRKSNIYNEIISSDKEQISNIRFYKDFLRDGSGLSTSVIEESDIKEFKNILKNIKTWNGSIKSLKINVSYKIQFTLNVKKERLITVNVYVTSETCILSLTQGDTLITSAGNFESDELLQWIKKMEQKNEFENIKI